MTQTIVHVPASEGGGAFDPTDIVITDNTSGAFLIKDDAGSPHEYMKINTTNGSEQIIMKGRPSNNSTLTLNDQPFLQGNNNQSIQMSSGGITLKSGNAGKHLDVFVSNSGNTMRVKGTGSLVRFIVQDDSNATFTLDEGSGASFKIVDDASSPNTYLEATEAGALSTSRNFNIINSTAPGSSPTNGCVLFADDVSSSSELKVRDEAGNITTLSPHNFSLMPEGASEEMAWSYYSEKNGKKINVDMLRLARLVEQISGEQIIFEEG